MKKPFISVIIPTLDEEHYLPKLLTSLAVQTNRNFEVIIVDGNSSDQTQKVARSYRSRIPCLKIINCKNPLLPKQRNLGAKSAKSQWLAFLDADTTVKPEFIEVIKKNAVRNPGVILSLSDADQSDVTAGLLNALINLGQLFSFLIGKPFVPGTMSIFHNDIFQKIGGFNENYRFAEDHEITQKLNRNRIRIININRTIYTISFRRYRSQGIFKTLSTYVETAFKSYVLHTVPTNYKNYSMGGHNFRHIK